MAKSTKEIWEVKGMDIPVNIYRERRYDNRISITKKGVNLRIPKYSEDLMKESYRSWAIGWLEQQFIERPDIASRFKTTHFVNGYIIETPYKKYILDIKRSSRATSSGKLRGNQLYLDLNSNLSESGAAKTIRALISRLIGKDQQPRISSRINEINDLFFKQEINQIRIKNNSSNWGSCSNKGNINISFKTLLAPAEIQDYIFVHELAHRIEMNHSAKYWALVAKVMPSYKDHERWIKENGHLCEI